MFLWYKRSAILYAYLTDLPSDDDLRNPGPAFSKSQWCIKCWILQELIALNNILFSSKNRIMIRCRSNHRSQILQIAGTDSNLFRGKTWLKMKIVALKISWDSRRGTTRSEDSVYCLMGLFDVNLPLLYGKGRKGVLRLQEKI
jgi:hypothetical protein